ncbi:hypothetical protein E1293_45040 [Actinomadura darangshiensis]|uniref:Uncharacterized protein n=1 Tax=Actinomadura darangshiensis TaxID=705336 RepID=A0A4R4ZSG0_9ACTN|nr:hypothetical protein [Actinomadura darangshiensis]TDD61320.1 hypothetical protein E1293_45040 [Actinomadura darangshiensis]
MTGKPTLALLLIGLVLLTAALWSTTRNTTRPDRPTAHSTPSSDATPSPGATPAARPVTAHDIAGLLPLAEEQIAAAAEVARRFTALYGTWRYTESTPQYLARLTPLMSAQLRPELERAAANIPTAVQRYRQQQTSTGQARVDALRALGPTSITVLATGTEHITTPHSAWQDTSHYAITVIHHDQNWRVYAFDLAATGDHGDLPDSEPTDEAP